MVIHSSTRNILRDLTLVIHNLIITLSLTTQFVIISLSPERATFTHGYHKPELWFVFVAPFQINVYYLL